MTKGYILIVDDDFDLAAVTDATLKKGGYRTSHLADADSALAAIKKEPPDLILLDVQLPGISGLKFLEILKQEPKTAGLPVIMITYRGDEPDKLKGLSGGADDYLVKPFSHKELLARVDALLRRVQRAGQLENAVAAGGISIDFTRHETIVDGKEASLRPIEFELLSLFIHRKGQVLTLDNLVAALSKGGQEMSSANVYVHINNLRKALGSRADRIETVHGIGYKFREEE